MNAKRSITYNVPTLADVAKFKTNKSKHKPKLRLSEVFPQEKTM